MGTCLDVQLFFSNGVVWFVIYKYKARWKYVYHSGLSLKIVVEGGN